MAPKAKTKTKTKEGGKGEEKKKTKAELDAEKKKEEDEARAAREAAKRVEEERVKRESEAKILEEERVASRMAELAQLQADVEEHAISSAGKQVALEAEELEEATGLAWCKYVQCDIRPDASALSELNTYLSLEHDKASSLSLDNTLKSVSYSDEITIDLQDALAEAYARGSDHLVESYEVLLRQFSDTCLEKLDQLTAHLLQYSDEALEESKGAEIVIAKREGRVRFGLWINKEPKAKRKVIDFGSEIMGIFSVDVPKQVAQVPLAMRSLFAPFHSRALVEQGGFRVLGGVYTMELLATPPAPKKVKGWVLRPETSLATNVQRLVYPLGAAESASLASLAAAPPIRLTLEVPSGVVIPSSPKVAWWDPLQKSWSEEFVFDLDVSIARRIMKFQTLKVGAFALLHSTTQDLPYVSWNLAPVYKPLLPVEGDGSLFESNQLPQANVVLTIQTSRFELQIGICGHQCRLLRPDILELSGLMTKDFSAGELLDRLSRAGIHLMPSVVQPEEALGRKAKSQALESHFAEQVACIAAAFDVSSNSKEAELRQCGASRSTFTVRESSAFTGMNKATLEPIPFFLEEDAVSASASLAPSLGGVSFPGLKFTVPYQDSEKTHSPRTSYEILTCLKRHSLASEEAVERAASSPLRFQKTIKELLLLTRVISFTSVATTD